MDYLESTEIKDLFPNEPPKFPSQVDLRAIAVASTYYAEKVSLSRGQFRITYRPKDLFVRPVNGFTPCGWFLKAELQKELQ